MVGKWSHQLWSGSTWPLSLGEYPQSLPLTIHWHIRKGMSPCSPVTRSQDVWWRHRCICSQVWPLDWPGWIPSQRPTNTGEVCKRTSSFTLWTIYQLDKPTRLQRMKDGGVPQSSDRRNGSTCNPLSKDNKTLNNSDQGPPSPITSLSLLHHCNHHSLTQMPWILWPDCIPKKGSPWLTTNHHLDINKIKSHLFPLMMDTIESKGKEEGTSPRWSVTILIKWDIFHTIVGLPEGKSNGGQNSVRGRPGDELPRVNVTCGYTSALMWARRDNVSREEIEETPLYRR